MVRDVWPPPHPGMFRQDAIPTCGEDNLPPPPPLLFEEEARRHHGRLARDQQQDEMTAVGTAAKSYASAASITLTSNASTMSSQTEESEEEDRKKVLFRRIEGICGSGFCGLSLTCGGVLTIQTDEFLFKGLCPMSCIFMLLLSY